jgi:hydroxymethylpyrimidine pyrophosphatase-like HAD family hydrolase
MCFGDFINDYSMFKVCDITVAMGNSFEELIKLADYITSTNDNDGVAKFLEKNLL